MSSTSHHGCAVQDLSAGASKMWGALPSMRFGSSAAKLAKAAQAEGKAAQSADGVCLAGLCSKHASRAAAALSGAETGKRRFTAQACGQAHPQMRLS